MNLINWELLKNPYNWIVVTLMILFAVVLLTLLQQKFGFAPSTSTSQG